VFLFIDIRYSSHWHEGVAYTVFTWHPARRRVCQSGAGAAWRLACPNSLDALL